MDDLDKAREEAMKVSFNYSRWRYPIENKNTERPGKDWRGPYVENRNRLLQPGDQWHIKFPVAEG